LFPGVVIAISFYVGRDASFTLPHGGRQCSGLGVMAKPK